MRALLPIPAPLVPVVLDALLTLYSAKAEAVHHVIVNDAADGHLEPVRRHRAELLDVDELLAQLDLSPALRAVEISGERDVLATATYDALSDAAERVGQRLAAYWHGRAGLGDVADDLDQTYALLRLLRTIEIDATAPTGETVT